MIEINLLPGAARKNKGRGSGFNPSAAFANVGEQFKDKYLLGTIGAVSVALAAVAGMYLYQSHQEQVVNDRERQAASDSARFASVLIARNKAEMKRDSVYQQLAIIKSIDDSRFTWPHLLEVIDRALPSYTWLTSIEQTSAITTTAAVEVDTSAAARKTAKSDTSKKRTTAADSALVTRQNRMHADSLFNIAGPSTMFQIIGQTVDIQALTLFMKNLAASPFIKNVQLMRSDLVTTNNKDVTEFQIEAETAVPPASLLQTVPLSIAVR